MIGVINDKPHPTFSDAVRLVQSKEKSISEISEAFDKERVEVWTDDDYFGMGYNNGLEKRKNIALELLGYEV